MCSLPYPVKGFRSYLSLQQLVNKIISSAQKCLLFYYLHCSLKHGVDMLESIQSGSKSSSKRKSLKVATLLIYYIQLNFYCNCNCNHPAKKYETISYFWPCWSFKIYIAYSLLFLFLKLSGYCYGKRIWKEAPCWCYPSTWNWCFLWGHRSFGECQGYSEGVSDASTAKTWTFQPRTTYEGR